MSWLSDFEDWLEDAWEYDSEEVAERGGSDEEILSDIADLSFEEMMDSPGGPI